MTVPLKILGKVLGAYQFHEPLDLLHCQFESVNLNELGKKFMKDRLHVGFINFIEFNLVERTVLICEEPDATEDTMEVIVDWSIFND